MSCPLCGAPSEAEDRPCPNCGWVRPGAAPPLALDDLPVYGQPSAPVPPSVAPDAEPDTDEPRRPRTLRTAVVAGLVGALLAAVVVGRLARSDPARAEAIGLPFVVDLPAGVTREPSVAWRLPHDEGQVGGFGDVVVSADEDGVLVALAASDGEERWRARPEQPGEEVEWMIPTGDGLALVTYRAGGGRDGALRVVARDLDDGTVRWSVGAEDGDFASLVGEDQIVVLSRRGPRHSDVAFHDARDGSEQWTAEGTLIAVGERLIYLLRDDALVAVELATGDERWSRDAGLYEALAELRGAEVGDTLLVGRSSRTVAGLSTADGTFRWSRSFEHPLWAMRAGGEVALVFSDDATSGIDPADGAVRWTEDDRGWQAASLLRFEGQDSLHALGDRVTRLDPATGARLARSPAPDRDRSMIANTAVADGVIYTAGDEEVLWALEPSSLERRWSVDVGAEIREVVAADGTVVVVTPGELLAYRG